MKIEQALQVLEQVRKKFAGSGDDHDAIRAALETIVRELEANKAKDCEVVQLNTEDKS